MKISIITVVYNNEKTIGDAIESVTSQTYKDVEYIVVDGKSTDRTNEIIHSYKNKITKHISENDKGIYDAMNKGVRLATGDIIGILNSDDLYEDNRVLQDVVDKFEQSPTLRILYGDLVYVSNVDTSKIIRKWQSGPYHKFFFERGNVPPHPALFVRREVYDECGLFNLDYKLAADYDFMLRIFKNFGEYSSYYSRLMVRMRLGGATNQSLKNIISGNREILKSWHVNGYKAPIMLMPIRLIKRIIQYL
jgi:glycosyltransferase involved in cell wall biosynthesis